MLDLAVVVPTFNERENLIPLLKSLAVALNGLSYEVIFVDDDSPDGTADAIRAISLTNPSVRLIHRINRRGLASACVEGMLATVAPYIAVMDADLQHDETILPVILERLKTDDLDLVVGSRNIDGGSMGEFAKHRVFLSMLGRRFSQHVCRSQIQDPMSGFFILQRRFLLEVVHRVSGIGFKILVDLLASAERPVRLCEVPYRFRSRTRGESKLDVLVALEYFQLLLDKTVGDYIPPKYILFTLVGCAGLMLHLAVLSLCLFGFRISFGYAQVIATVVAMTANFLLNNTITYRDRRLRGWALPQGLVVFYVACSIGVLINIKLAELARASGTVWYLAGAFGLAVSSVWNYGVTGIFTWRTSRKVNRRQASSRVRTVKLRTPV